MDSSKRLSLRRLATITNTFIVRHRVLGRERDFLSAVASVRLEADL